MRQYWNILAIAGSVAFVLLAPGVAHAAEKAVAEDVDVAPQTRKSEPKDDELPLYRPSSAERALEPEMHIPCPKPLYVGGSIESMAFVGGTIRGYGNELRAHVGTDLFGGSLGLFQLTQAFSLQFELARDRGVELRRYGAMRLSVLIPAAEAGFYLGSGGNDFHLGGTLVGLRLATCEWEVSLRAPSIVYHLPFGGSSDAQSFTSIGTSISAGYIF